MGVSGERGSVCRYAGTERAPRRRQPAARGMRSPAAGTEHLHHSITFQANSPPRTAGSSEMNSTGGTNAPSDLAQNTAAYLMKGHDKLIMTHFIVGTHPVASIAASSLWV